MGNRKEKRSLLEQALVRFWSALNPLLTWKGEKYKGIAGEDIAKALLKSAKNQPEKLKIYHWREMHDLLQR